MPQWQPIKHQALPTHNRHTKSYACHTVSDSDLHHQHRHCLLQLWNYLWQWFIASGNHEQVRRSHRPYREMCRAGRMFCSTSMGDAARTDGALLEPEGSPASAGNFRQWLWLFVVLAVTNVRPDNSDHNAHRGGRKTRLGHITRVSWHQWPKCYPITHPEKWKWASTDIIRYTCVTACVTPTTPHKQHAPTLATVPFLTLRLPD